METPSDDGNPQERMRRAFIRGIRSGYVLGRPHSTSDINNIGLFRTNSPSPNSRQETGAGSASTRNSSAGENPPASNNRRTARNGPVNTTAVGGTNSPSNGHQAGAAGLSGASAGNRNPSGTANQASAQQGNNSVEPESVSQEQGTDPTFEGLCTCLICSDIISGTNITRCGHRFCGHCIRQWLERRHNCPVCRSPVNDHELIRDNAYDEVIAMLQAQVDQQPPNTERSIELDQISDGVDNIRQEATIFTDHIEEFTQMLEQYERMFRTKEAEMNRLQAENQILKESQTQLSGALEASRKEVERLHLDVYKLRPFEQLCADKDAELKKLYTQVLPAKQAQLDNLGAVVLQWAAAHSALQEEEKSLKSQIETLEQTVTNLSEERERALQDKRRIFDDLQRQSEKLGKIMLDRNNLKQQCQVMEMELRQLKEELIPSKDSVNEELRQRNTDLQNELDYLERNVRLLNDVPESQLYQSLVKLQHFYDRDYRTKIAITENMVKEMHALLEVATCELQNNKDVEGKMAEAISSHLSVIEENSSLHETASQQDAEIRRLKNLVHVSQERVLSLQKRLGRTADERPEE